MRIMALDIGDARCGIAVSDPKERVASPVCVLPAKAVQAAGPEFRRLLEDWEPGMLVAGLPLSLAGREGPQAAKVRRMGAQIAKTCGLPIEFADERLSSREAKRILREEGNSEADMRGKVDMVAASLFLQAWLDERAAGEEEARS